jgi:hypothetical protein
MSHLRINTSPYLIGSICYLKTPRPHKKGAEEKKHTHTLTLHSNKNPDLANRRSRLKIHLRSGTLGKTLYFFSIILARYYREMGIDNFILQYNR